MSEEFYVKIDIDQDTKIGIFESSHFGAFREHFSCENKSRNMIPAHKRKYVPKRNYMISPNGDFSIGLLNEIYAYAKQIRPNLKNSEFEVTSEARYFYEPKFLIPENYEIYQFEGYEYRDIQEKGIRRLLDRGRGVFDCGTSGGKGLVMAGLIKTTAKYNPSLNYLVIVPPHLVEKTRDEFVEEYQFSESEISCWDGDNKPNFTVKTLVVSSRILRDDNIENVVNRNVVLIDECHIIKSDSLITKQIKKLKTNNILGYTGTVPLEGEDQVNRWCVLGNIGKIICQVSSDELRNKGFKSKAKIVAVRLKGCKHRRKLTETIDGEKVQRDRGLVYKEEESYLLTSENRNKYIRKFIEQFCKENTLVPIDFNYHEDILRDVFKDSKRTIYFVNGETKKEERKRIYNKLETDTDAILFVKTGVMREGISIKNLSYMIGYFSKKSFTRILQLMGRIERIGGNKVPVFFDFYDDTPKSKDHFSKREEIYHNDKISVIKKEVKLDY